MTTLDVDVHGLRARVSGWPDVVGSLQRDFAWFARAIDADAKPAVEVVVERGTPRWDALGDGVASFVTPRNVVFHDGARTIVDYFGRAVSVLDETSPVVRLEVIGEDEHLVHEAAYLFLLSRFGEHLDAIGLPRVHALGLSGPAGAVAVLLPSGGGKSTMALRALRSDAGVKLLSEDTPLVDAQGRLHPFPLRLGVNPGDDPGVAPERVRRVERMEFHPKLLVDVDAFSDRIERSPQPLAHVVIGRRSLGLHPRLRRTNRRAAIGPLLREAVVGVGVYQGMEFLLQRGPTDIARLAPVGAMRARCCAAALRRATVWELVLGRDHEANWALVEPLVTGA